MVPRPPVRPVGPKALPQGVWEAGAPRVGYGMCPSNDYLKAYASAADPLKLVEGCGLTLLNYSEYIATLFYFKHIVCITF